MNEYGPKIERICKLSGMKPATLADHLGIHPQTLYYYIDGQRNPGPENKKIINGVLSGLEDESIPWSKIFLTGGIIAVILYLAGKSNNG